MCMSALPTCMCICPHVHLVPVTGVGIRSLELELQVIISYMWVPRMELGSFGRATGVLYHQVISPAPGLLDFALKSLICAEILSYVKYFCDLLFFPKWIDLYQHHS